MQEKEKYRVVLADRDGIYLQKLRGCLERRGDMVVVGMTDCGSNVPEIVRREDADIVIMDILLGSGDGFWVLEKVKKMKRQCLCLIVSAIDSDRMVRKAIGLGVDYYMAKPVHGDLLLERLHQLLESVGAVKIRHCPPRDSIIKIVKEQEEPDRNTMEAEISSLLSRMGIPASLKGYHFVRRAVLMVLENENALSGITKGLYPDIGKHYKTTASKVERAIRHAIESAWKKNGRQVYFEIVGYYEEEKPTNGRFIAALAEHFRMYGRNLSGITG